MTGPDHDEHLDSDDALVRRALGTLDRSPLPPRPATRAAIMRRIRETPLPAWRRAWDWLAAPRPLALSPLAAAAAVLLLLAGGLVAGRRLAPPPAVLATAPGVMPAHFVLVEPTARAVSVTGTFAGWDPAGVPLRQLAGGAWVGEIPLAPGIYQYVFVVDGREWRPDPNAAWNVADGLGQRNSVLVIAEPGRS